MQIRYHKHFVKYLKKQDKNIQFITKQKIKLFIQNPFDKQLRNHALLGKYIGCRSIDITGDIRLIYREISTDCYEIVMFLKMGTHSQLYG